MSLPPIRLLGIDAAFANVGLARLLVDPVTLAIEVEDLKLIVTEKTTVKRVRVASDDLSRARLIFETAHPWVEETDLMTAEVPSGGKSARTALAFGIAIGILAGLNHTCPLIEVNQTEVKKGVTGRGNATKDEMIAWAIKRYPKAPWLIGRTGKTKGKLIDANEHLADAIAVGHAAILTPEFKAAHAMRLAMAARAPTAQHLVRL